jgi:hypothetical protein
MAFGDANTGGGGFGKEGDAFVEVDVPALDSADHLLVLSNRAGQSIGADLAGGAKLVRAIPGGSINGSKHPLRFAFTVFDKRVRGLQIQLWTRPSYRSSRSGSNQYQRYLPLASLDTSDL